MSKTSRRTLEVALAVGVWMLSAASASADCAPQDLTVVLNTGWDEEAGAIIPSGGTDDDWDVIVDASAGVVPRDADVVSPHPAWLTMPNSQWISADKDGPIGTYRYQTCWCMHDNYTNPDLNFAIRADDKATVLVNGTVVLTLPEGTFNDATALGMSVNPALLHPGENCLDVVVENIYGVVTGFNLVGTVTADDGKCCDCDETDIVDNGSTGVNDDTGGLIASGSDDDEWIVTADPGGGVPRPAGVVNTFVGWNVIPGTKWISANLNGPNGTYTYEKCWCMNPLFESAQLSMQLLADDRADVFLNGNYLGSTPPSNAFLFPATSISTSDQSLFQAGENCVTIDVTNVSSVVTGLDVAMTITATNAECCPCAELPSDAEGWWPLDEPTGPTAADLLNGHDGTWVGAPPPPLLPLPGVVNLSLLFDGLDDNIAVPDHPGLDFGPGQDFSFDAWIKTDSNVRQAILHKKVPGAPTAPGYSFATGGGMLSLEVADGTNFAICVDTLNIADGDWHFVAATVDRTLAGGMTIRLYVDEALRQTCNATSPFTGSLANAEQLYFGAAPMNPVSSRMWWKGQLDEIEIFRRVVTTDQLYNIFISYDSGKCREFCEDSTGVPICAGDCPTGLTCVAGSPPAGPCACVQQGATCGGSFPVCNGGCPDPDEVCEDVGNACECVRPIVPCGDPLYPACDEGACPANQQCMPTANQGCTCITCGTGSVFVGFAARDEILWTPVACALVYNVYRGVGPRLVDQNADGLADDYGSCHVGDIIGTDVRDSEHPQPGAIHWYLVTGEDFTVEGSPGTNSSGQARQVTNACP